MDGAKQMADNLEGLGGEIAACRRCALGATRTLAVPGEGAADARVVLIGEAPGSNEDRTGRPFCGNAGRVLDELLASAGIPRRTVFIGNILKCRPPGNRDPLPGEKAACAPWLNRQLEIISPRVVCCLGNHAAAFLLDLYGLGDEIAGISRIHGRVFTRAHLFERVTLVPLYHPAVAAYNASMKDVLKRDFQVVRRCLDED